MFVSRKTAGIASVCATACLLVISISPLHTASALTEDRIDKQKLIEMLRSGAYAALDRRMNEVQQGFQSGRLTEQYANRAFDTFACADPSLAPMVDTWIERHPRSVVAHIARGNYYRNFGFGRRGVEFSNKTHRTQFKAMKAHFERARESYETALRLDPRLPEAYTGLIRMAMADGGGQLTTLIYQKALEFVPDAFGPHRAFAFSLRPEWNGSKEILRRFVEEATRRANQVPGLSALRFYFDRYQADRALNRSDFSAAINRYTQILGQDLNPHDLYKRGRAHYFNRDDASAVQDLTRSLKLSPNGPRSLHLLGLIKIRQGSHRQAIQYFTRSIEVEPLNPKYLLARADAFIALRQFEKAEADLERARVCGHFNTKLHATRAEFYERYRHDHVNAVQAAGRLVRIAPLKAEYWKRYTDALFVLQDCRFIDASARYLEVCLANADCGRKEAAHVALMARLIRGVSSCTR